MLRLFICKKCKQFFPAPSEEDAYCPKCKENAIPTDYFMVDLLKNNAAVTREIYQKYNIEYEEFTDMMVRVDEEERLRRTFRYKVRMLFRAVKKLLCFIIQKIKSLVIHKK